MTSILVFGGRGQLGQELQRQAFQADIPLISVARVETDIADITAVSGVIDRASCSFVVNAAAYTKVDGAENAPNEAFRANATGPGILARACAEAKLPLVHISSDYVFDGAKTAAYSEQDAICPLGVYGRSKAAGEASIRETLEQHLILRTSWVYGVYGANFLKTVLELARTRNELRIVADQRGCPTGTADLACAILNVAPRLADRDLVWGTYHFAGGGVTTWHGFATEIVKAQAPFTRRRPEVVPITTAEYPTLAKRPANSELDSSRFAAMFSFRAADWRERSREVVSALLN